MEQGFGNRIRQSLCHVFILSTRNIFFSHSKRHAENGTMGELDLKKTEKIILITTLCNYKYKLQQSHNDSS